MDKNRAIATTARTTPMMSFCSGLKPTAWAEAAFLEFLFAAFEVRFEGIGLIPP